jgi:hemerythrin-like domain-containing protein
MAARKKSTKRTQSSRRSSAAKQSASSRSRAGTRGAPDAIALLKADHQLVQGLFDQFEKTRSDDRKAALAEKICSELRIHTQIEEEILYPAAREAIRDTELIAEATVEHASAKDLIAQIEGEEPGGELYDAKVKVLGEYIKHHVKEEHNELFPQVRKSKLDLKQLGEQLQARKSELQEGGGGRAATRSGSGGLSGSRRSSGQGRKTAGTRENEGVFSAMARGMGLGGR